MDKKSKIFLAVFLLLLLLSIGATFWRIVIRKNYVITAQLDCDPTVEKCFIWRCDPESTSEDEACTGDPEYDVWYYQIAKRNAANIPNCNPEDEECDPFACDEGEKDCEIVLCDEATGKEQEAECNDPKQYNIDNPEDMEEEIECEEGDEECLNFEEDEIETFDDVEEGDVEL